MKTTRDWQQIAADASVEKDPKKLLQLTTELERAFEERDKLPISANFREVRKSA